MIDGIGMNTTTGVTNQISSPSGEVMGKDDFLNLLVTQLKYQDPLNPTDSTQFTAQLAQFSALEAQENTNSLLESLLTSQTETNNARALNYIGKTVYAYGSGIDHAQGVEDPINFNLESNANVVYVNIYDDSRTLIKTIDSGPLNPGKNIITWDGTDNNGNEVSTGLYNFEIFGYDYNDNFVNAIPYMETQVTGVSYYNGEPYLNSGEINIPLSSIFEIAEGSVGEGEGDGG